jgi:HK97 family phage portal protein
VALFPNRGAGTALARLAPTEPKRLAPVTGPVSDPKLEKKSIPVLSYPLQLFFDIARTGVDSVSARNAMAAYALCYSCLRYRASKLTEPPLWIVDETNDGESWLEGEHELTSLLELPNPDMEMQEFLDLVSLYLDTTGACLIVKNTDRAGRTASLYPFARDEFSVEPANGRLYGRFQVRTLKGTDWKQPEDVIYLRTADARGLYSNVSPTDVALSHINLGRQLVTAIKSALRNAVRPGAIVTIEGELSDEGFQRMKGEVEHNYEGVYNAGKTVLLEGGGKLAEAKGGTLKDMSIGPLQEDVESAICSAYQVHPVLVQSKLGVQASSGMSDSIKPLQDLFYDTVILPRWGYIERAFTRSVLRPVDDRPRRFIRFDTSKVRGLQVDMTAKVQEAAGAVGFWLIDEQRAHTQKKPLPNKEGQVLAADRLSAEQEQEGQQAARAASTTRRDTGQKTLADAAYWLAQNSEDPFEAKVATVFLGQRDIAPELVTKAWEAFDQKAASQEDRYATAARAQLNAEETAIVRTLEAIPAFKDESAPDIRSTLLAPYIDAALLKIAAAYSTAGLFYRQWLKRYRPLIEKTMRAGGADLLDQVGVDFTQPNPTFQQVVQRRVTKLAGNVTETTLQQIRDVIGKARTDGVTMREMTTRIRQDVFSGAITKTRATTIARTETVGALNEGEMIAAQSSGVMRSKKWISQRVGDSRERHIAEENAGWVAIDAPFTVTGKQYPHDGIGGAAENVNCRCSQLFSDLTADEANRGAG